MIILGLGSNLGKREELLREAVSRIAQLKGVTVEKISFLYESEAMLLPDADPSWNLPYLNCALAISSDLTPDEFLKEAKNIEAEMGRHFGARWSPRPIDIDILLWHDLHIESDHLTIPHSGLLKRPFALLPLSDLFGKKNHIGKDIADIWRNDSKVPFSTLKKGLLYPKWMGILNLTPDSFSDGGLWNSAEKIYQHVSELIASGADIIDVGAESTRPNSVEIQPDIEWQRLEKYLPTICQMAHAANVEVSLDTRHSFVAEKGIEAGIDWLNDVSASSEMIPLLKNNNVKYVLMHSLSVPPEKDKTLPEGCDVIKELINFAKEKIDLLEGNGISKERIIFDVGLGFGKTIPQNYEIIERANELRSLGLPLLFGHSRKSFLSCGKDIAAADLKTAKYSAVLAEKCVDYLRVHSIKLNAANLSDFL